MRWSDTGRVAGDGSGDQPRKNRLIALLETVVGLVHYHSLLDIFKLRFHTTQIKRPVGYT